MLRISRTPESVWNAILALSCLGELLVMDERKERKGKRKKKLKEIGRGKGAVRGRESERGRSG